ncbi:MAG: CNNM domain-containing protein, partial [Pseudomonadota bacterium]
MNDIPLTVLFGLVAVLLAMSAFFSSSETALMSLNRYRLRHRAKDGHRGSQITEKILARPDRLIGLILLGNNLVNFSASTLTALIALRIGGETATATALGTIILTLVVLIFAEVAPKTMAALYPERIALPAAYVYYPLLKICMPIVRLINLAANGVLLLFGIRTSENTGDALSREELRTVVTEAGAMLSARYRRMLVSILDLEKVTVDDVMVSRNLIIGIDLTDDINDIVEQLESSDHTRLPVYRDNIDN